MNIDTIFKTLTATALSALVPNLYAANLNLSNDALEVISNVEPNVVLLTDDSGSMDWGVITKDYEGKFFLGGIPYYYTHPAPGVLTTDSPAANTDTWVIPSEEFLAANGLAAPQGGVWRAWNHAYNPIYYNPNITYDPWKGLDINGNAYTNVSETAAPFNPYRPADGTLDLTTTSSYATDCGLPDCVTNTALSSIFTVTGFYPARYYRWIDSNTNDLVDADDSHSLVEIRSTTPSYSRLSYNASTGVGRSDCTDVGSGAASCSYAQEIQNFANWFSYYRKRDLVAKAALSKAIEPLETVRLGLATTNNSTADNLRVASMNTSMASGNKKGVMDKLFSINPDGSTPLRSKLNQAGRYYECRSSDLFGSSGNSAPGSAGCPVQAAPAGSCQQNFTVLMTDGFWNGTNPAVGNVDTTAGDYSGGAFADTHNNTLADVAMHYYNRDLHTTLDNNVSTTAIDMARYLGSTTPFEKMHQHMTTYAIGFGVEGTLTAGPGSPASPFSWPDPASGDREKIDDVAHAAYNGRGRYLTADNSQKLQGAFQNILSTIQAGTGTATAVAFNTQEVEAGTLIFRASFNTKTHRGSLVAQRINADGSIDSDIHWDAAQKLDEKTNPDQRVIITYQDTGATSTGVPFRWGSLNSSQQSLLDAPQPTNIAAGTNTFGDERVDYLRGNSALEGPVFADGEFRERATIAGKLGDIVHSTPVFVGRPHFIGRNGGVYPTTTGETYPEFVQQFRSTPRKHITYTGANDGMLHAFDTANGSEVFAYVPNMIMDRLPLLSDPGYSHRFFVDLTPSINDVYMTPSTGTNASDLSWNTVLVGGLGAGGKGYFALNVTQPDDFLSETSAATNVLWEFNENDDGGVGNSDLGFSFSRPVIAMSNAEDGSGNKRWVVIFGNGYNSSSTDGDAHLYILFIEGGQDGVWSLNSDFYKVSTSKGIAESATATPNGISGITAVDSDNNGTVDYVYGGDLQGNVYRFDLSSATPGNWTNAPKVLFSAKYSSADTFPRTTVQPITNAPGVVRHPDSGYIVIVGTGSWMTDDDASSTDIQSIYGLWDDMTVNPTISHSSTTNQLVKQTMVNFVNPEHDFTVRGLSNNAVIYDNTGSASTQVKGWYIDLDLPAAGTSSPVEYPGERAVRNIQIRGGLLFVNTIIPKNTAACGGGVGGFELGFNPITGGSGSKQIFDLDGDGRFTVTDNSADLPGEQYLVVGLRFDAGTPTDAAFIGNKRFTHAGNTVRFVSTNTKNGVITGRTSWREIEP